MRGWATLSTALLLIGCDRVPWHRFIVPDPVPDRLYAQYSNADCGSFPRIEGMVVIEYDQRGCACTSAPEDGAKWGPEAFTQRRSDGSLELREEIQVVGGGTTYYDDILQISTMVLRDPAESRSNLAHFLEQCAHLPNVDELARNETLMPMLRAEF